MNREITITIEFTGIAKQIAGQGSIRLSLPYGSTFRDVIQNLSKLYPDMVNIIIDPNEHIFLSSNLFIINNEMTAPVFVLEEHPKDGDKLTLLAVMTGG